MTHTIELEGKPCYATQSALWCKFGAFDYDQVPLGMMVKICAWHDEDKAITRKVLSLGYQVSHGICHDCKNSLLNTPQTTQKQ